MHRLLRLAAAAVVGAGLAACSSAAPQQAVPVRDAAAAAPLPVEGPEREPRPPWAVDPAAPGLTGTSLAEIRERPDLLADRRLPTPDLLPPPADGRFRATVAEISPEVRERMGESWSEACPVPLTDLRYLTVVFRGFDGAAHTGELVVHAGVAHTVVEVFRALFEADFPIEEMRLVTTADHHAPPTGDGNNTAGYNCRTARGQKRWSAHAYGTSVDINPFQNPMDRRGTVIPELAAAYVDRSVVRPGMLTPDNPAVQLFTAAGWHWGGDWTYSKDWMHFSTDGS